MNSSNITLLSSSKETFLEAAQSYEQNVASCKYKEKLTCINQKERKSAKETLYSLIHPKVKLWKQTLANVFSNKLFPPEMS